MEINTQCHLFHQKYIHICIPFLSNSIDNTNISAFDVQPLNWSWEKKQETDENNWKQEEGKREGSYHGVALFWWMERGICEEKGEMGRECGGGVTLEERDCKCQWKARIRDSIFCICSCGRRRWITCKKVVEVMWCGFVCLVCSCVVASSDKLVFFFKFNKYFPFPSFFFQITDLYLELKI